MGYTSLKLRLGSCYELRFFREPVRIFFENYALFFSDIHYSITDPREIIHDRVTNCLEKIIFDKK